MAMKAKINKIKAKIKGKIGNLTFKSTHDKLRDFFYENTRIDNIRPKIGHLKVKIFYACIAKNPELKEFFEKNGDLTINQLIDKDPYHETFLEITTIAIKKINE